MSSGHIITQRRKCMGLTQEKLAEQINVSRQTIAMWETSKQFPEDSHFRATGSATAVLIVKSRH